jgi:glycosyltransferase involved in cell wall biosynthesis
MIMPLQTFLSIVITTYNRANLVHEAIDSALTVVSDDPRMEIVVVDDCSEDNTVEFLWSRYKGHLEREKVRIVALRSNLGATGAKNAGAKAARGEWVVFLDSDDLLLPKAKSCFFETLTQALKVCPIVFFRSCSEDAQYAQVQNDNPKTIFLRTFIKEGTPGECLPAVRTKEFLKYPYHEDLRGFESLSYASLIKNIGPALISQHCVRVYRTNFEDRISTASGLEARSRLISMGYLRLFRQLLGHISLCSSFGQLLKALYFYSRHLKTYSSCFNQGSLKLPHSTRNHIMNGSSHC